MARVEDVPPRLPTARGALRRSLALWGWGHLATGDRRGVALALFEIAFVGAIAWAAPPLVDGSLVPALFLAGLVFLCFWGAVALTAYRRAVRVREAAGMSGADGGATELLWLAPVAIAGMLVLWGVGGTLARPEATVARYVDDWRSGDVADAASLFVAPTTGARVIDAWTRHDAKIRNDLARLAGSAGADSGIDPDHPFDSIRFVVSPSSGGAGAATDASAGSVAGDASVATSTVAVQIVKREAVRGTFFGLFPTSSQTLVAVDDLGTIVLRRVDRPSGRFGVPDDPVWLIERVELLGEPLGGG